jgi:hypothetical protein
MYPNITAKLDKVTSLVASARLWVQEGLTEEQKEFLDKEFTFDTDHYNNRVVFHLFPSCAIEKIDMAKVLDEAGHLFSNTGWVVSKLETPVSLRLTITNPKIHHPCVIQINEIPPDALTLASIRVDLPRSTKYVIFEN